MASRDKDVLKRAQERFADCESWEGSARSRFRDDICFLYADSDNYDQWNAAVRANRQIAGQPMLTINKTHTHWLHVVNQAKENRPAISVIPTGEDSSYAAAQIMQQIINRIEYLSDAETAYMKAAEFQVGAGIGYWRITTAYADEKTFDQEIFIKQVPDPLSVYLDPHIKTEDGSDARFGFVFEDMPREAAEDKYGKLTGKPALSAGDASWNRKDTVRIAEYYEREEGTEWLYAAQGDDGETQMHRESELPPEALELIKARMEADPSLVQRRRVKKHRVRWYLIVGEEIVDRGDWPGRYIPIVRVIGEELTIEQRLDRKGIVRYLKDAQRSYNYNASAAIEFGALQSKSPYLAPIDAVNGLENYWSTANTQNHAYLPYNHIGKDGQPIPPPQRQQPPSSATSYLEGMQTAEHEMMMASGQYDATFSAQGNEISGVSIQERRQQGERATFHYLDQLAKSIRFTGKQLLDLIPKVYDTKRVLRIMGEAGDEQTIQIDPDQRQALKQHEDQTRAKVETIFNPGVGQYDIQASVGPNYETRRRAAFEAMTSLVGQNAALANVIGDLYMGNADFPAADKLQERMRNWIKATNPGVLGGPTPQEMQMQAQLQAATDVIGQLQKQLMDKSVELQLQKQHQDMETLNHLAVRLEEERQDMLAAFKAETDRLKALAPAIDASQLQEIIDKMVREVVSARDPEIGAVPDAASVFSSILPEVLPMPTPQESTQPQQAAPVMPNSLPQGLSQ